MKQKKFSYREYTKKLISDTRPSWSGGKNRKRLRMTKKVCVYFIINNKETLKWWWSESSHNTGKEKSKETIIKKFGEFL